MSDGVWVGIIGLIGVALNALILREQGRSKKMQEDARKRTEILLEASEACLDGLLQLHCNGNVTKCHDRLQEYKNSKAAV